MRCTAAFTLIELMVGIAVAAILITVGIPGFRDLILDNRMAA
jgi:type IV fimbrial biogenesis protein FimT